MPYRLQCRSNCTGLKRALASDVGRVVQVNVECCECANVRGLAPTSATNSLAPEGSMSIAVFKAVQHVMQWSKVRFVQ